MINSDLYKVYEGIKLCGTLANNSNIDFSMGLARIADEIEHEIAIIEKGKKKPSEDYKKYLEEKQQLDIEYAIQKEDGTYQMLNNTLLITNAKEYYSKVEKLNIKYKKVIDEIEKINTEFTTFLEQECKTKISKIKKVCLPSKITVEQLRLLYPVIEK